MKAVVVRNPEMVLEDVPKPKAVAGEVVIKVKYCGICGSDLHRHSAGGFPDGSICGHEPYGLIDELGPDVEGWQEGDRVVAIAYEPCKQCGPCLQGEYQLCPNKDWIGLGAKPGAFAEYVKVYSTMLLRVPEQVDDRTAAMTEPLAVALHAVRSSHINLGDTVVVIGAGPIGLLVTQCVQIAGARAVGVVESTGGRREIATRIGADVVFAPDTPDVVSKMTQSLGAVPDVVFDCAGAVPTLQNAIDLVRPKGKVTLVGVSMKPVPITAIEWGRKEAELKTSIAYRDEFPLALELLAKGRIDVESLISGVIPLQEVGSMIKTLQIPSERIKVLVEP